MRAALLLFATLTMLAQTAAASAPALFGLVVGNNSSDDSNDARLRYADDDAIQNAVLLQELGAKVLLLVEPDADSKRLYPKMRFTAPTAANLQAAMDLLNEHMEAARIMGATPILYFFYSGHGGVDNNQGYVHLQNSRLTRADLRALLKQSLAQQNHLIIDACKSYFLVFERGVGGHRKPARMEQMVTGQELPPNVGVLLSTSTAADSHEWEAYQAGIFSHEVRSALRGAADIDGDDQISYTEASAFIWSANNAIPNQKYRPRFLARAPTTTAPILLNLRGHTGDRLHVGPNASNHVYIEDGQGLRLADFHPGPQTRLKLLLPKRRPLFVRNQRADTEVELPQAGPLYLAQLPQQPLSTRSRSAAHIAFTNLFLQPFDHSSINSYNNRPAEVEPLEQGSLAPLIFPAVGIGGVAVGLLGGGMTLLALQQNLTPADKLSGTERGEVNQRIDVLNSVALTSYTISGVALFTYAGYLTWTLLTADQEQLEFVSEQETP